MKAARMLRHARRAAGLSQREMAGRAGVPQSTVARIELGQLNPRVDTLDRLLRAAGQQVVVQPIGGEGVDRTQIRELLLLSPLERIRAAAADANAIDRLLRSSRHITR
jgi:transcriptional regulator with XRE-family HTH domain